jgi:hypothetical protein
MSASVRPAQQLIQIGWQSPFDASFSVSRNLSERLTNKAAPNVPPGAVRSPDCQMPLRTTPEALPFCHRYFAMQAKSEFRHWLFSLLALADEVID